jgi:E3 ubiquitin-protein ligase BRE1
MDTGICKQLRRQVEFSQSETRILREQIDQTIQELESVKMERQLLFDQIDSESQEKLKALESEIQKLSGDLNRIRTGRDQLQQQLELEKAKRKQHDDLNQELKLNAKANKDRIVCLLEEIKRIKSRFAAFSGDRELFRDVLLACDLPIEEMENEKAILGHKSLIQSLRDRLAATEQTVQSLRDCLEASELSADQKNAQEAILREKALIRRVDELQLRIKQNEAIFGSVEQHSDQSTESSSLAVEAVKKQKEIDELKLKIEHFELVCLLVVI